MATSSWQSIPSILKIDSACNSQTRQVVIESGSVLATTGLFLLRASQPASAGRECGGRPPNRRPDGQHGAAGRAASSGEAGADGKRLTRSSPRARRCRRRRARRLPSTSRMRTRVGSPSTRNVSASTSTVCGIHQGATPRRQCPRHRDAALRTRRRSAEPERAGTYEYMNTRSYVCQGTRLDTFFRL